MEDAFVAQHIDLLRRVAKSGSRLLRSGSSRSMSGSTKSLSGMSGSHNTGNEELSAFDKAKQSLLMVIGKGGNDNEKAVTKLFGNHPELMECTLDDNENNNDNGSGFWALHYAAYFRHPHCLERLLELARNKKSSFGVRVIDARAGCGRPPLALCTRDTHAKEFAMLIRAGANMYEQNSDGDTVMMLAMRTHQFEVLALCIEIYSGKLKGVDKCEKAIEDWDKTMAQAKQLGNNRALSLFTGRKPLNAYASVRQWREEHESGNEHLMKYKECASTATATARGTGNTGMALSSRQHYSTMKALQKEIGIDI